jgi:hypothetical protein
VSATSITPFITPPISTPRRPNAITPWTTGGV